MYWRCDMKTLFSFIKYNHFHPIFEKPGLMRPLLISDNIVELQILYIPDKFQL